MQTYIISIPFYTLSILDTDQVKRLRSCDWILQQVVMGMHRRAQQRQHNICVPDLQQISASKHKKVSSQWTQRTQPTNPADFSAFENAI